MASHQVTGDSVLHLTSRPTFCASLISIIIMSAATAGFAAEHPAIVRPSEQALQNVVSSLRARLSLPSTVVVSIVSHDALMMSVEAPADPADPFRLSIDASFLATLNGDEIEAAIAHELGHVWVFTHHPYLQTEELANQIAMRVVSRESLERVYEKVWQRGGTKGDLARLVGCRRDDPSGSTPVRSLQRNECYAGLAIDTTQGAPGEDSSRADDAAGR